MSAAPNSKAPMAAHSISPHHIERMLTNQEKDLELRAKELQLQAQQDNHSFQFAQSALEAQSKDRESNRTHQSKRRNILLLFVGGMFVLFLAFLLCASYMNKDAMAMELVKILGSFICGGGGGYAFGKYQKQSTDDGSSG